MPGGSKHGGRPAYHITYSGATTQAGMPPCLGPACSSRCGPLQCALPTSGRLLPSALSHPDHKLPPIPRLAWVGAAV